MNIEQIDQDALTELFNVGLHRAAASLSELTNQHIVVEPTRLWICPIEEMSERLLSLCEGDLATVHQIFSGAVAGDAILLIEYEKAATLTRLMTSNEVAPDGRLDESAREVLAEIGNIVLSACLSAFGDMLRVSVTFAVPRIRIESVEGILRTLHVDAEEMHYAMIATTRFRLSEQRVDGYLVVVVGVRSLALISTALAERIP